MASSGKRQDIRHPLLVEAPGAGAGAGAGGGAGAGFGAGGKNPSDADSEPEVQGNGLGTVMGVFLPCTLSIFGAILFLRLTWAVGQAGVIGAFLIFLLAGLTVTLTSLSIAAISTNGTMKGGGAYYMISRALGPEFGGAVGVVFFAANSVGITFYLIAFAGELDVLINGTKDAPDQWMIKLYASVALAVLLVISMVGAQVFTKLNLGIFVVLVVSIITSTFSFVIPHGEWKGFQRSVFSKNVDFAFTEDVTTHKQMDFFSVFVVCFPAMTGIMAGANMSGDLANPGKSIGPGTLAAIGVAMVVYLVLVIVSAGCIDRDTLTTDLNAMQHVAFNEALVAMGVVASTISSALGNLTGSGRILQALARDGLFPFLSPFAWGTKKGDEPIPAILLAWLIAQACVFIGSLNAVASIISEFFLLVYLFVNVACFALRVTGAPNFRPRFKYFSWHTALAGAILCIVILFVSSPLYAAVSIAVLILVFVYVHYKAPVSDWGDISQALLYHQVRKYLLRIDERKSHVKFWRPSVLLLVQDPASVRYRNLFKFCNNLKKGGIYVLGSVLVGDFQNTHKRLTPLRSAWLELIDEHKLKGFPEITVGDTASVAIQNLVLSAGLGGMKPNTVVVPLYEAPDADRVPFGELPDTAFPEESKREPVAAPAPSSSSASSSGVVSRTTYSSIVDIQGSPASKISQLMRGVSLTDPVAGGVSSRANGGRVMSMAEGEGGTGVPNFVSVIRDCISLNKNVLLTRGFAQLDRELIVEFSKKDKALRSDAPKMRVDVWITPDTDTSDNPASALSLTMQLANILQRTDIWAAHTALRVVAVVETVSDEAAMRGHLTEVMDKFRFRYDLKVVSVRGGRSRPLLRQLELQGSDIQFSRHPGCLNELMRLNSAETCLCFMAPPAVPGAGNAAADRAWMEQVHQLTLGLPPTVLVMPSGKDAVVTDQM